MNLADVQRAIKTQTDKLTEEKDLLESQAKSYLENLAKRHHQQLAEKQEAQKKTLDFLHKI